MEDLTFDIQSGRVFAGLLKSLFVKRKPDPALIEENRIKEYLEIVKEAKCNLENIDRLFNNTADPDLIEYAIYEEYAAKLRFSYLIKKAKEKNIKSSNYISV